MKALTLLITLIVLALSAPAHAVLTEAEKATVVLLVESSVALREGESHVLSAAARAEVLGDTPAIRADVVAAMALLHRGQTEHWQGVAHLLHTGVSNTEMLPNLTPAEWHSRAWFYLDRYSQHLTRAQAAIVTLQAYYPSDTAYQNLLRRARDLWVATAKTKLLAMDRDLSFTNPWPALRDGTRPDGQPFTIPTVVGPHGDYRRAQWLNSRAKNYLLVTYGDLLAAYKDGATTAEKLKRSWTGSRLALNGYDKVTALYANAPITAEEAKQDAFCRALWIEKLQTFVIPASLHAWNNAVLSMLPPSPVTKALGKIPDSWKHSDWSAWSGLVFVENVRCESAFLKN